MRDRSEGRFRGSVAPLVVGALALLLMGGLLGCENKYDEGFKNGREEGQAEGFVKGKEAGYAEGYRVGYNEGYATAMATVRGDTHPLLRSIDGTLLSSKGSTFVFWLFASLNFLALIGATIFLVIRQDEGVVIVAKIMIAILASYVWFRVFEPWILGASATNASVGNTMKITIELAALFFGILLCFAFDHFYIKRKEADVWVEAVGVATCSLIALSLVILVINRNALFKESDLKVVFHGTTAVAMGGLAYTAWALLSRFVENSTRKGRLTKH